MEKNTLESALKEFSQTSGTNANDVKEFFALMSDGSIKRMPKEDMATVLGGLFNSNGYAKLRDYGVVKDTLNDKISGYGYSDGTTPEGDCGFPGVFSSECNGLCAKMIKVSLFGDKVAVRSSSFTGTWNAWKELTFK